MIQDAWVEAAGEQLHYLMSGEPRTARPGVTPLVYLPGSLGSAEQFKAEMERLAPRPCISVSVRGAGRSAKPTEGYGLDDRVQDLVRVMDHAGLGPACLMAFSLGVPVAIRAAAKRPELVSALVLLDYPMRYPKMTDKWAASAEAFAEQAGVPRHVLEGVAAESRETDLAEEFATIEVPTLVVLGGQSSAVTQDQRARYSVTAPHARVVVFEDSGHELWQPDYERFMRLIETFLEGLDGQGSTTELDKDH